MSQAQSATSPQTTGKNQNILLTTSGTLDLYVLPVGNGTSWVLPKSLALDELVLKPRSIVNQKIEWRGQQIPLVMLGTKAEATHALVIEGEQDHLRYAIATTHLPHASKVRISAIKDVESESKMINTRTDQYVYQYVTYDYQLWIVPDLEKLEQTLNLK